MSTYKLSYFNVTGRAEVSRYLFALAEQEYEDHRFELEEWPSFKEKAPFGNCPIFEVDGKVLCQSHAIERYLARKFGFGGKSEWDKARVDMIVECMEDFMKPHSTIYRMEDGEKKKELIKKFCEEQGPKCLDFLENILKENAEGGSYGFFVGDEITLADLNFYHFVVYTPQLINQQPFPESWSRWPGLKTVMQMVANNPKIKEWHKKRPDTI